LNPRKTKETSVSSLFWRKDEEESRGELRSERTEKDQSLPIVEGKKRAVKGGEKKEQPTTTGGGESERNPERSREKPSRFGVGSGKVGVACISRSFSKKRGFQLGGGKGT